jgi:hypothetical protein
MPRLQLMLTLTLLPKLRQMALVGMRRSVLLPLT